MNKQEVRELMKATHDEISLEEYNELENIGECCFYFKDKDLYFKPKKPKQKFPIVLEDKYTRIEIEEDGDLEIKEIYGKGAVYLGGSLPLLKKAIKISEEIKDE